MINFRKRERRGCEKLTTNHIHLFSLLSTHSRYPFTPLPRYFSSHMGLGNIYGCLYLVHRLTTREKGTIATIGALGAMYLDAKYAIRYDVHMLKSVRSVLKK